MMGILASDKLLFVVQVFGDCAPSAEYICRKGSTRKHWETILVYIQGILVEMICFWNIFFSSVFLGVRWAQKTLMYLEPRCLDFWAKLSVVELIG